MGTSIETMPLLVSLAGIVFFTILMGVVGIRRFKKMAMR